MDGKSSCSIAGIMKDVQLTGRFANLNRLRGFNPEALYHWVAVAKRKREDESE